MATTVVRYEPRPDEADENQRLIEEVFDALTDEKTVDLRYTVYRLADGAFVHVAQTETEPNPLTGVEAFRAFSAGVADRCEPGKGPDAQSAVVVGSYVG